MAPSSRPCKNGSAQDDEEYYGVKRDRKARKPLVEKMRRARINESLHELRGLLADSDLQTKTENAEVLEMTVKRVENILRSRDLETDTMNREASERFAAGYVQCMHEVHMFLSNCPGIDAAVAAELLNHLLESMPLNEDHFQDMLVDLMSDSPSSSSSSSTWPSSEGVCPSMISPGGTGLSHHSPAPSTTSSEDTCSDLDETDTEPSHTSPDNSRSHSIPGVLCSKSMWRPW
ncbi:transcription cofactor HES-6-like [Acipenser oxyrinchus oxyrinchus]|uniref:Transcription cofactor HES-6 n=1 Tax=Acipenser oxyrinchus oxyrinchus TaxID=40147 RepID=A0AAD8G4G6_ACIOX|nr:transcription cofactor HES-6-like [Acipenser oxyrinchus oxyrinchus]